MAENEKLLSNHRQSDEDNSTDELSENASFGPFKSPSPRKKKLGNISLCAIGLVLLIVISGSVGAAYRYGAAHSMRPLPEPKNLGSCGASAKEARKKGCAFDFMLGGWLHPQCIDQEQYDRYMKEWLTLNMTMYAGPDAEEPAGLDYILGGDWDLIWGVGSYHYLHCSYVLEKNWKALTREIKRVPSNCLEEEHVTHCLALNSKPNVADMLNTTRRQVFERMPIMDCLVFE
ncbi:uncharacterized protein PpBr36_10616 [Pyricularia pennisetigena]|uniref:uncharacterized protein n=1 Tax=Pyricularia pennisetigena TaxID=1578925 RepID=UPI0011503F94|nr:uncharacterized protein PpBr36_10616 [Pyricularia pennisetigena]TLS21206.1 hypothetical protein PpBr36_10616 [Pyricularia pennisetigena]